MARRGLLKVMLAATLVSCTAQSTGGGHDAGVTSGTSAPVPPGGGTVELAGVGRALFPAGAFAATQQVRLEKTSDSEIAAAFDDSAAIFRSSTTLGHFLRVNTGGVQPLTDVQVTVSLPAAFAVPPGEHVEAFARFWQQDEQDAFDSFELVGSSFDAVAGTATLTLPPGAFTAHRRTDGTFEAVVTLAPTPGLHLGQQLAAVSAPGDILPPLDVITVRSPFNPDRKQTVNGVVYTGHWGTDLVAEMETPIYAAGDGTVVRAYDSGAKSFGNSVLLEIAGAGVVRYAHLASYDVQTGDRVLAGQMIGLTDNTGLSTGAHLHFEYAPDGKYWSNKSVVDPAPRMHVRPLPWDLTATAVFEFKSLISISENRLELSVQAHFDMQKDSLSDMVLTLTGGTLNVVSYTGRFDQGAGRICNYVFSPTSYPLIPTSMTGPPQEGDTVGGLGFVRNLPLAYKIRGGYYTDARPVYTEVCPAPAAPTQHPIVLANSHWLALTDPNAADGGTAEDAPLDPLAAVATGTRVVDSSIAGYITQKTTYGWTFTKRY
jgi:murein DD-endopeptidase MepM/ murein hydrolase activator NlpD